MRNLLQCADHSCNTFWWNFKHITVWIKFDVIVALIPFVLFASHFACNFDTIKPSGFWFDFLRSAEVFLYVRISKYPLFPFHFYLSNVINLHKTSQSLKSYSCFHIEIHSQHSYNNMRTTCFFCDFFVPCRALTRPTTRVSSA